MPGHLRSLPPVDRWIGQQPLRLDDDRRPRPGDLTARDHARDLSHRAYAPGVDAQAVATSGVVTNNRFRFGVGSGEALNEHILGDAWPAGFGPKAAAVAREVAGNTDWAWALKTVHRKWPTQFLPGKLGQVLPDPAHFEQASTLVTEETVADQVVCGDELEEHVPAVSAYTEAGFDEVYVGQIGPEQQGFIDFYRGDVLPRLRAS